MESTTDTESIITLFSTGNSQLQDMLFQHSHWHYLCIFASNEEPAYHAYKNRMAI